jgi:hypothetical protein
LAKDLTKSHDLIVRQYKTLMIIIGILMMLFIVAIGVLSYRINNNKRISEFG